MIKFVDYNIKKYVDSIIGGISVNIEGILNSYKKCKKYQLESEVSEYIRYIDTEPFYISPSFTQVKTNVKISTLNPKFVLFSAPGATGKSSLAKYIAYRFNALYWNLANVKIGTNSFAGSILSAVSPEKYSEFIRDLNTGDVLLVIDAFDEAEIVSGRKMLNSFISDISVSLNKHQLPTVFLLARTETAQYIASFCAENHISITHYEIGFFDEESAKHFVIKSISADNTPTKADIDCVNSYYDVIRHNITEEESKSFLGYAPVLEAISIHIKNFPNRQKMISELSGQTSCVSIITKIMDDLLVREQTQKVIPAFIKKCRSSHPEFSEWDKVYSPEEQLIRLISLILFNDTSYENYSLSFLPPQLVDDYQELLHSFLPQHPFIRIKAESSDNKPIFTGPAFRDYSLAKVILNPDFSSLAEMYFEESQSQSYCSSQIFFDCYTAISNNVIHPNHISYVYDSFKAKATAYERPYMECSEITKLDNSSNVIECLTVFDMMAGNNHIPKRNEFSASMILDENSLHFDQLANVFINAPHITVSIGHSGFDARIYNSSVICKNIEWKTNNIAIESYPSEGCLLVARESFIGNNIKFDIVSDSNLKVYAPNLNIYYRLYRYNYNFEDNSKLDIIKFIHALHCILIEFRTHRKDTLAKTAERIEFVTVGGSKIKRKVLEYLKYCGIIYTDAHLYKINEAKMQEKHINFNALSRMDIEQLDFAFRDFCEWIKMSSAKE